MVVGDGLDPIGEPRHTLQHEVRLTSACKKTFVVDAGCNGSYCPYFLAQLCPSLHRQGDGAESERAQEDQSLGPTAQVLRPRRVVSSEAGLEDHHASQAAHDDGQLSVIGRTLFSIVSRSLH